MSANVKDFCVMYRIGSVNELVVNGKVYDEMKAVIEFPHNLFANIGGHTIEAGYSDSSTVIFVSTVKQLPRRNAYFEPISAPKRLAVEPYP